MTWVLIAAPLVLLGVYDLRAVTHAPTPDRRPGELPDLSRARIRRALATRGTDAGVTP